MADTENPDVKRAHEGYRHHATTLFLGNEKLREPLQKSADINLVAWTFLLGVAIQVFMSFADKYCNWINYQERAGQQQPLQCG